MPTSVDKFIFLHKYFQPTQAEQFVDEGRFDIPAGVGNSISQAEQGLDSVHLKKPRLVGCHKCLIAEGDMPELMML